MIVGTTQPVRRNGPRDNPGFHAERFHPNNLIRHGHHPGLDEPALIDTVHSFIICAKIEQPALAQHSLLPGSDDASCTVFNTLDDKIDFGAYHAGQDFLFAAVDVAVMVRRLG